MVNYAMRVMENETMQKVQLHFCKQISTITHYVTYIMIERASEMVLKSETQCNKNYSKLFYLQYQTAKCSI